MKTHRLLSLICDFGLYDEKVDVAMRIRRTASVGTKQNDLGPRRGSSQTMSRLGDKSLIDSSHDRIVNLAADNSYHAFLARERIQGQHESAQQRTSPTLLPTAPCGGVKGLDTYQGQ